MGTIEERAKEYSKWCYDDKTAYDAYIAGAKEQKAIDIDKACQWIIEHIDIPYEEEFINNEPTVSDYIDWCEKRIEYANAIADNFRKSMEE
ncbi:hypothetical protein [Clostridium sp.]|uniref:hypothetical protein n=1 Tax=Clostridium sp. TaxID=1506 RepID=UPI0025C1E11B|nr:hypothetical protein [Clostridium sp.]